MDRIDIKTASAAYAARNGLRPHGASKSDEISAICVKAGFLGVLAGLAAAMVLAA